MASPKGICKEPLYLPLAEELAVVAQADCVILQHDYTHTWKVKFRRPGYPEAIEGGFFETYDLERANNKKEASSYSEEANLIDYAKKSGAKLDIMANKCGAEGGYPPDDVCLKFRRLVRVTVCGGIELEVPEDEVETDGKTINERFDAIQQVVTHMNTMLLGRAGERHVCQMFAEVKQLNGKPLQIVNDENWTAEKFIYWTEGTPGLVTILKSCPDENGKGGGEEIMLRDRDLEDVFPSLHDSMAAIIAMSGFSDFKGLAHEVDTLVGGRREFARALSEMSSQSLAGARSEAAKVQVNQKEGFYEAKKGFGCF